MAKARTLRLTKRSLDALSTTDPRGERFTDSDLPGFVVAVYPSGRKVFELRYGGRGRRRRIVLGAFGPLTVERARELARERLGDVAQGGDPATEAERKRKIPTWREWVETYLAEIETRKRSVLDDRRYLRGMLGTWGPRPLDAIRAEDVERGVARARESVKPARGSGRTTGNRWLASVRACLAAAWRRGFVAENVARRVKPLGENPPRSRVLDAEELARVLEMVERLPEPHTKAAFLVLIETGCRRSEILRARVQEGEGMTAHPSGTSFARHAHGCGTPRQRARIEAHVAACSDCWAELTVFVLLVAALRDPRTWRGLDTVDRTEPVWNLPNGDVN